jgi:hypothetical protein
VKRGRWRKGSPKSDDAKRNGMDEWKNGGEVKIMEERGKTRWPVTTE